MGVRFTQEVPKHIGYSGTTETLGMSTSLGPAMKRRADTNSSVECFGVTLSYAVMSQAVNLIKASSSLARHPKALTKVHNAKYPCQLVLPI